MTDQDIKNMMIELGIEIARIESKSATIESREGKLYGWYVEFVDSMWFVELDKDAGFRLIWGNKEFVGESLISVVRRIWEEYLSEEEQSKYLKTVVYPRLLSELE